MRQNEEPLASPVRPGPSPTQLPPTDTATPEIASESSSLPTPVLPSGLEGLELPDECSGALLPEEQELLVTFPNEPCSDFVLSPDQSKVAFQFGPNLCGRGVIVLEAASGQVLYRSPAGGHHNFQFLSGDQALIGRGHCEGGTYNLLDIPSQDLVELGPEGEIFWNQPKTVFAVHTQAYSSVGSVVWGYNLEQGRLFLPPPETWEMDDAPTWAPDGQHLLYRHRSIRRDDENLYFDQPSQVIRVDAASGEKKTLLSDPAFDFHPCQAIDACPPDTTNELLWWGEWLPVWRFPFRPARVPLAFYEFEHPAVQCAWLAKDCPEPGELFSLNYRTGEKIPGLSISR